MEQDKYNLRRFLDAQEHSYDSALSEIRNGRKHSHWMWYIFPQVAGLGRTHISKFYSIKSLDEAREYLNHPVLDARLREISEALLTLPGNDVHEVMGHPDHLKLKSSMTLFDIVSPNDVFIKVIDKYFGGIRDQRTLAKLNINYHQK